MIDEKKLKADIQQKLSPERYGRICNPLDVIYGVLQIIDEQPKAAEFDEKGDLINCNIYDSKVNELEQIIRLINEQPKVGEWIPFEFEEDENGIEIFSCPLPDDGEEILVSDGQFVWMDTFMIDGEMCYLDNSSKEFEDLAWMSLPEPYMEEKDDNK